jgi:hypothetical protein
MNRCVGIKCNRVCGKGSGLARRRHRVPVWLVFVLVGGAAPGLSAADTGSVTDGYETSNAPSASDGRHWNDEIWDLLQLIFAALGYIDVEASADLEQKLLSFSEHWAAQGLPEDMSAQTAFMTLEALADLEVLLLAEPDQIPLFVRLEALTTIASMREAILTSLTATSFSGGGE